jgi:hypothetical protein
MFAKKWPIRNEAAAKGKISTQKRGNGSNFENLSDNKKIWPIKF